MDSNALFTMALQLNGTAWRVSKSEFAGEPKILELKLDFERGSKFGCPECGKHCPVHDTSERRWRHLNFFEYRCELVAPLPRVQCSEHGTRTAHVPWATPGSGFTLMMEALMAFLCQQMPVSKVAELLDEHDTLLWRLVERLVHQAHSRESWANVRKVLIDETSSKRGHRYVSCFVDAQTKKLLFMVEGKGAEVVEAFAKEMANHDAKPEQIELVCMDMSPAFEKGVRDFLPNARIAFDFFHIMQLCGKAVDEVRKSLQRQGAELKGAMWLFRGNSWEQSAEKLEQRETLSKKYRRLGRALELRESLQDVLRDEDEESLKMWCNWAMRSRLASFKRLAKTIRKRWSGVTAFMETRITNGLIEAINANLQLAKRLARGFRSFSNFRAMAYLKSGGLELDLPPLRTSNTHTF